MIDGKTSRAGLSFSACAALLAMSMGGETSSAATSAAAGEVQTVQRIARYCTSSWRNARISRHDWDDCTQEAFAELLTRVSRSQMPDAIDEPESPERRELNRAIWRIVQRCRRAHRPQSLESAESVADGRNIGEERDSDEEFKRILETAKTKLSPRQSEILLSWSRGERIAEIADRLGVPPAQVSDAKYKAVQKLREALSA